MYVCVCISTLTPSLTWAFILNKNEKKIAQELTECDLIWKPVFIDYQYEHFHFIVFCLAMGE